MSSVHPSKNNVPATFLNNYMSLMYKKFNKVQNYIFIIRLVYQGFLNYQKKSHLLKKVIKLYPLQSVGVALLVGFWIVRRLKK